MSLKFVVWLRVNPLPQVIIPSFHELTKESYCKYGWKTVFILGRGIAGIPNFCEKSPKLSDTVQDKSPTTNHVAIIFKIRLIFHTLGR